MLLSQQPMPSQFMELGSYIVRARVGVSRINVAAGSEGFLVVTGASALDSVKTTECLERDGRERERDGV